MKGKEEFVRYIRKTGTSLGINIPLEVIKVLDLKENEIVRVTVEKVKRNEKKNSNKKGSVSIKFFMPFIGVISIILLLLPWKYTNIFGFVIISQTADYEDIVNLETDKNYTYNWTPQKQGLLKSIKLRGSVI